LILIRYILLFLAFIVCGSMAAQPSLEKLSLQQLDSLYDLRQEAEVYDSLIPIAQVALQKATQTYGKMALPTAKYYYRLGIGYDYSFTDFEKAATLYHKAIAIYKSEGKKSIGYAEALHHLAFLNFEPEGKSTLAETRYIEVIGLYKKLKGENFLLYVQALEELANIKRAKGDYDDAFQLFEQVIELYKKYFPDNSFAFSTPLNNFALLCQELGDYKRAEAVYFQALDLMKESVGEQHADYAAVLNNIAGFYVAMGKYSNAEAYYLQIKELLENIGETDHPGYSSIINNLASTIFLMGRYKEAEHLFLESLELRKAMYGEQHPIYANSLINLSYVYKDMGKPEKSIASLQQAKDIIQTTFSETHPQYANAIFSLANTYKSLGVYTKARRYFEEVAAIRAALLGKDNPDYASAIEQMANVLEAVGEWQRAEQLLKQAAAIYKQSFGESHPSYAKALINLATLYSTKGDYSKAYEACLKSIRASSDLPLSNEISKAWTDSLLDRSFETKEDMLNVIHGLKIMVVVLKQDSTAASEKKSLLIINAATALLKQVRDGHLDTEDKLRMLKDAHEWMLLSLSILDEQQDLDKAFAMIEQNKSILIMEASRAEKAYQLGDLPDSLMWREQELFKQRDKLEAMLIEQRSKREQDSLRLLLNEVNVDLKQFVETVEQNHPTFAKLKYQKEEIDLAAVQANLGPKDVLLEYVIAEDAVYIFCIQAEKAAFKKEQLSSDTLNQRIDALHHSLSDYQQLIQNPKKSFATYNKHAYWFYEKLIKPVEKDLPQNARLIVVPDGKLAHLPFEAFLTQHELQSNKTYNELSYLVNQYTISYNYSAALWHKNKQAKHRQNNGQLLGIAADYQINKDSISHQRLPYYKKLRKKLLPLPEAQKEIELLEQDYKGTFIKGTAANERKVKQLAGDFAIIHLAMHGLLNEKSPILSSLVLTENNDSSENNFLQAYEISKLKLAADLVVLSACETGYGRFEKGNGVASLARSFMYAGASSLVVSLWQVNDMATAEIMKLFYQYLNEGLPKDKALQQAKLAFIQSAEGLAAHPAFWSSFIQIGNTDPIPSLAAKNSYSWIAYTLLFIGTLLVGIIFMRRRRQ